MTASIFTGVHNFFHSSTWKDLSLGLIALVLLFWLATIYWVFKDARRRIEDPFLIDVGTSGVLVIYDQSNAIIRAVAPGQWNALKRVEDVADAPDVYSDATKAAVGA